MDSTPSELAYITGIEMDMLERLYEGPLDGTTKDYLFAEFGEHGKRREIANDQKIAQGKCVNLDGYCCGYCEPYRAGPLIEEIIDVIRGMRKGTIDISKDPRCHDYHVVQELPF